MGADALRYAADAAAIGQDSVYAIALGWLKDGDTVLDVGCNTGYVGRAAKERLRVVFDGIEGDAAAAAEARKTYREVVCVDLASGPPWPGVGGPYDAVLALDVLEHLPEPVSALRALAALLTPAGHLVLSVPNVAHWTVRLALLRGRFDYVETGILDRTHLRFFTRESLLAACAEAGLSVREVAFTTNSFPLRKLVSHGMRRRAAALLPGPLAYQFVARITPLRAA
jgi:2-polyprenyl-3-methyl-5-hydroxy-6-metoxy-1,4-benzoquinol methylase